VSGYKEYLIRVEGTRVLAANWLRVNTTEHSKVLTGAIGHLGYISGRYIIDGAGLVTPLKEVKASKPDYFVDSYVPKDWNCSAAVEFSTGWSVPPKSIIISVCASAMGSPDIAKVTLP
jgi:hypothetical protein